MKVSQIEIPYENERGRRYRFFEILPGALSWTILIAPFILSIFAPTATVFFIIVFMLLWFVKSVGLLVRNFQGLRRMDEHQKLDWQSLLTDLEQDQIVDTALVPPDWHHHNLARSRTIKPSQVYHAIIIATYNESREVLEPTIQSVLAMDFDMKKVILVLAYEQRGGPAVATQSKELIKTYAGKFYHAFTVEHPANVPNEVIGKGSNLTHAGRELQTYLEKEHIDPINVVVTTLDSDNRPHTQYLSCLTYLYTACPEPVHASFQPIPIFTNNIWDAPAPMRVIATGNSFWNIILSMRPHMIRNFSSHAQGMKPLIDTDFWSVRTIVEDGHQFWRTYMRYNGKHQVYPMYIPIYQDAVLAGSYRKTLKMQFIQLRRWAWGASDVAYVAEKGFFSDNDIPKTDLIMKFGRLLEGHISWATAPLILAFSAFVPALINPRDYAANQLPIIASHIQRIAMVGIIATLYLSLKTLPPKPERYKKRRTLWMVLQWVYLPITTVLYNAMSALYSQTRLMFGMYMTKFDVTEKAVITEHKKTIV